MFQQGKKFKNNQNKYNNLVKNKNLKQISSGKINIVNNLRYTNFTSIEGFEGEDRVEKINSEELDKLEILEKSFDDSMNQYMVKYKKYLEELQTRQVSEKSQIEIKLLRM